MIGKIPDDDIHHMTAYPGDNEMRKPDRCAWFETDSAAYARRVLDAGGGLLRIEPMSGRLTTYDYSGRRSAAHVRFNAANGNVARCLARPTV